MKTYHRAVQRRWRNEGRDRVFLGHGEEAEDWQRDFLASSEDERRDMFEHRGWVSLVDRCVGSK